MQDKPLTPEEQKLMDQALDESQLFSSYVADLPLNPSGKGDPQGISRNQYEGNDFTKKFADEKPRRPRNNYKDLSGDIDDEITPDEK